MLILLLVVVSSSSLAGSAPVPLKSEDKLFSGSVKSGSSPLQFVLIWDANADEWGHIEVTKDGKRIQLLSLGSDDKNRDKFPSGLLSNRDIEIQLIDFNEDGYRDLILSITGNADGDPGRLVWLFLPKSNRFSNGADVYRLTKVTKSVENPVTFEIHPGLQPFIFQTLTDGKDHFVIVVLVGNKVRQVIRDRELFPMRSLEVKDFNFDGYGDLVIPHSPCTGNCWSGIWLFQPAAKKFAWTHSMRNLSNPESNPQRKEIQTFRSLGFAGSAFDMTRYGVEDSRLVRQIEVQQRSISSVPGANYKRTVHRWINGKATLICEALLDLNEDIVRIISGDPDSCREGISKEATSR